MPEKPLDWRDVFRRESLWTADAEFARLLRKATESVHPPPKRAAGATLALGAACSALGGLAGRWWSLGPSAAGLPPSEGAGVRVGLGAALGALAAAALSTRILRKGLSHRSLRALRGWAVTLGALASAMALAALPPEARGAVCPAFVLVGAPALAVALVLTRFARPKAGRQPETEPQAPAHLPPRPTLDELACAMADPDAPQWAGRTVRPDAAPRPTDAARLAEAIRDAAARSWRVRYTARLALAKAGACALSPLAERAARDTTCDGRPARGRKGRFVTEYRPGILEAARVLAAETERLYGGDPHDFLCPHCLARYARLRTEILGEPVDYVACPTCSGSCDSLTSIERIVCTLDSAGGPDPTLDAGTLRVNWLARASRHGFEGAELFDFDRVEILRATDQDVAHFLVDVANDTNPKRRARYREMDCVVLDGCSLSEGTLQALKAQFGGVRQEKRDR